MHRRSGLKVHSFTFQMLDMLSTSNRACPCKMKLVSAGWYPPLFTLWYCAKLVKTYLKLIIIIWIRSTKMTSTLEIIAKAARGRHVFFFLCLMHAFSFMFALKTKHCPPVRLSSYFSLWKQTHCQTLSTSYCLSKYLEVDAGISITCRLPSGNAHGPFKALSQPSFTLKALWHSAAILVQMCVLFYQ